jgi:taurine dioxygenase
MVLEVRSTPGQDFNVSPLSPLMAAEVTALDLRKPLDSATRQAVYDTFVRYQVLAFRDQSLTKPEQIAFTEQFGTLERHVASNRGGDIPLLHVVSNLNAGGKPSGKVKSTTWHSDKSFRPEPSMATILHAVIMPPDGGDTCFANMYAAYDALDEAEKAALDGLRAIHSWELSQQKSGLRATEEEIRDAPPMSHPLVRVHPDSGRKCLFMGLHASHIDGWPMADGRALLAQLEAHATQDRFVYRHKWHAGDVLMWDNRCTLHTGTLYDDAKYFRVMHRLWVKGDKPF